MIFACFTVRSDLYIYSGNHGESKRLERCKPVSAGQKRPGSVPGRKRPGTKASHSAPLRPFLERPARLSDNNGGDSNRKTQGQK